MCVVPPSTIHQQHPLQHTPTEALAAKQAAKKQQQQEGDEEQQSGKRRIRKTGAADEQDGEEDAQPRVHQGAQEEGQVAKKPKVVIAYDDE